MMEDRILEDEFVFAKPTSVRRARPGLKSRDLYVLVGRKE